jgi:large subunit ribosomal protein L9
MKVLFLQLVANVGHPWEIKEVSDSYARNFLIPKGYAKIFTSQDQESLVSKKKKTEQQRVYKLSNRREIWELLNGKEFSLSLTQENGKVFWSIGEKDIRDLLEKHYKLTFAKSDIDFPSGHIKKHWKHDVLIKIWGGMAAKILITVS